MNVSDPALVDAVNIAVCVVEIKAAVAVNAALVAWAGTCTVAGNVTAALLLDRLTSTPPAGAAVAKLTAQLSAPLPVIDPLAQVRVGPETVVLAVGFTLSPPHPAQRQVPPKSAAILVNVFWLALKL